MGETFSVGDVVILKSGGPRMTVARVENNKAWCVWFAKPDAVDPCGYEFAVALLDHA